MSYKVEINQTGRGGTIYYLENDQSLSFDWEFSTDGADVFVTPPEQWDANCEGRNAAWAKGRRGEILERVAAEIRAQKAHSARVSIDDNWIHFTF
ncbi:MAG TPA: hypothetical protein VE961_26070 [Pyrinomonadaceae bacterium]|nr:hypothetical protein [Pyrinomonadaceae bacterium]